MSSNFEKFINEEVYDFAVKAGSLARSRRVDKATVSNILSLFQGESDPVNAVLLLIAYIGRQMGRGEIAREVGVTMINDLKDVFKRFRNNKENFRLAVHKYLVLVRWVYESGVRYAKNFEEFIKELTK